MTGPITAASVIMTEVGHPSRRGKQTYRQSETPELQLDRDHAGEWKLIPESARRERKRPTSGSSEGPDFREPEVVSDLTLEMKTHDQHSTSI